MKLEARVDRLEIAVEKHLEESGEIRADLKWLKKSFWMIIVAIGVSTVAAVWSNNVQRIGQPAVSEVRE